jgi:hypothetical protein
MLEFFREGGWAMFFVLAFGSLAFVAAVIFAVRPDPRRVDVVRDLTRATVFSIAAGMVADLARVGHKVPNVPEWANSPKIHLILLQGFAESMAPGVLGFTLLSLVWLVMAVGHRRLGRELPVQ